MAMRAKSSPRKPQTKRRILILDDHPLVRQGLTPLIGNEPNLLVCAEAATYREGLDAIFSARADLVITDLSLKDGCGRASTRIYGVALRKSARRTVEYACALCSSRALYLRANNIGDVDT